MIISYLGGEFIKVQFGETVLAFNPPSKDSGLKPPRFRADLALISLNHPDMNGASTVAHGDREPFVIAGPGEYETRGVAVRGLASESLYGGEKRVNTLYSVLLEGMRIVYLGAVGKAGLASEVQEELGEIDILFLPIGGEGTLAPAEAYALAVSLEPRLIIPMHYAGLGEKDALKRFLKEAGSEKTSAVEKLTLKKKDLEGKDAEVAVLSPSV